MVDNSPLTVPKNIKDDTEVLLRYLVRLTEKVNTLQEELRVIKASQKE